MAKSKKIKQATNKKNIANAQKRAKIVQENHEVLKRLHNAN